MIKGVSMQVWRQPKQAKKGKKGAEPLASSATATESLSADLEDVHSTLASGVKVSTLFSDTAGSQHQSPESNIFHHTMAHTLWDNLE